MWASCEKSGLVVKFERRWWDVVHVRSCERPALLLRRACTVCVGLITLFKGLSICGKLTLGLGGEHGLNLECWPIQKGSCLLRSEAEGCVGSQSRSLESD